MTKFRLIFLFSLLLTTIHVAANSGKLSLATLKLIYLSKHYKVEQLNKQFNVKRANNTEYVNTFVMLNDNADLNTLKESGVRINNIFKNIVTAQIPVDKLETVSDLPAVKYIQVGTRLKRCLNAARISAFVDNVHKGTGLNGIYTGKDVVVGIIDEGFQYNHANFLNPDGTFTRIKRIWNQNATGTPPAGYSYGAEYKTQSEMFSVKYDFTDETHGTHVAGIAAGGDKFNGNQYYGVAPDADMVLVSFNRFDTSTDNVSVTDGIKYIYDYASSVNKPCVVNMSLGTHDGPHDGTSAFDQICDELQGEGKLLVGSAGNEGSDQLHLYKQFVNPNQLLKSFLKFYNETYLNGETYVWGQPGKDFQLKAVIYNHKTNEVIYSTPFLKGATNDLANFPVNMEQNGAAGEISIYTETNPMNNKPSATLSVNFTELNPDCYVGFVISATDGSFVNVWADDMFCSLSGNSVDGWSDGDSNSSIGEVGGTGKKIITVGAYTSKSEYTNIGNITFDTQATVKDIAYFSSKGPTADDRTKPDITAPGSVLVSSCSDAVVPIEAYQSYLVKKNTYNNSDNYYAAFEGTSMSAPFVTGVLALWLQAYKKLSPDLVRNILKRTAINDDYTGLIPDAGSNTWGRGKIDAWNGIKYCVTLANMGPDVNNDKTILVYPNPCDDNLFTLFPVADSGVTITILTVSGQQIMQKNIGAVNSLQESNLDVSLLSKGAYLVHVKGNGFNNTYKILKR